MDTSSRTIMIDPKVPPKDLSIASAHVSASMKRRIGDEMERRFGEAMRGLENGLFIILWLYIYDYFIH